MNAIFLLALVLLVLVVLGLVQAVRIVVWLFAGAGGRQNGPDYTTSRLRRLREQGYITPEAYEQVMGGLAAWKAHVPPKAAAHFAARQSAETPDAKAEEPIREPAGPFASSSHTGRGGIEPNRNSLIPLPSAAERRASPSATRGSESIFEVLPAEA